MTLEYSEGTEYRVSPAGQKNTQRTCRKHRGGVRRELTSRKPGHLKICDNKVSSRFGIQLLILHFSEVSVNLSILSFRHPFQQTD